MLKMKERVKHILVVASGKGGVGKSTTAVNVGVALAEKGKYRVGILDADIYGPNQPQMLGVHEKPTSKDGRLEPVYAHGLQSMSIGYLIDANTPMVWRGPMVTRALQQLLQDTHWDHLDYLIIDLPPGTGDIQLSLAQKFPLSGAILVTTPQEIALLDVRKAIAMFNKVNVPLLGVVENMASYICEHCGHKTAIFGEGGGQRIAKEYNIPLLGLVPLDSRIREQADKGKPIFLLDPLSTIAESYRQIAENVVQQMTVHLKKTSRFPNIIIEKK